MSNSLDEAHAYLDRARAQTQSLQADKLRLTERVAQLEQQLAQARTHKPGCKCECPGQRSDATAASSSSPSSSFAAAAHSSPGSIPVGVSQPIMDILFGDDNGSSHSKAKATALSTAASSSSPTSSPSKRAAAVVSTSHHLSTPRSRTRKGGATTSTTSSPTASMSDADKVLAMLDSDSATSTSGGSGSGGCGAARSSAARSSSTATTATGGAVSSSRKSKRKSGDADLDAEEAGEVAAAESVAAKTNKFIRVTSPAKRSHVDATAATEAIAAGADDDAAMVGAPLDRQLSEAIQPSQDAFDREIFEQPEAEAGGGDAAAAAAADDRSSPDFDYRTHPGAVGASEADTLRALWSTRILPLDSALLSRASHEADVHKRTGNDHFTSGDSQVPQALLSYSHAIKVLETGLERCGIRGEADLKPWIELMVAETSASAAVAAASKATIALIAELASSLHPKTVSPGLDPFSQMKILLRQLSSVYANRATAFAKMKPPQLLKAISDVNYVITLQPFWFKGYGIKASILVQQRCHSEAVLFFEQALATPGVSRDEANKLTERMEVAKAKLAREQSHKLTVAGGGAAAAAAKDGGSDRMSDCSSPACGSLGSTHMGATSSVGVKSSTAAAAMGANRSPLRSHSAAAGSSSSAAAASSHAVGAAAGSVAKPIELLQGSGSGSYPRVIPSPPVLSEVPVHPPSLHTPVTPPSVVRQASEEQQFNLRQDSVEWIQQRQDSEAQKQKEQQQRKKAEEEKQAAAAAAIQVKRETRSAAPAAAAAAPSAHGLHAPLADASNRVSPTPRSHLAAPAPASPARPSSSSSAAAAAAGGSASKIGRSLVHDLTQSPTKPRQAKAGGSSAAAAAASGGRQRASPSRSPARSPARDRGAAAPGSPAHHGSIEPVDWFQLPIITVEGIRDLLGDECFAESLALQEERRVDKIKIQRHAAPNEGLSMEEALQEHPRLLGLVYRTHVQVPSVAMGRRSGGGSVRGGAVPESKENQHYTVSVRFDADNRCKEFSCQCREEREQREDERDRSAAAAASAFANSPPPVHVKKEWTACKHVGAVLLVLRSKQEAQEKSKPLDLSAADRARRSMFVTPARRKTIVEQKKEAALRAELQGLSNAQLQSLLSKNKQSKSGSKEVLVARIIENSTLGNLPRCSKCNAGAIFYAAGAYHCHGSFDPVSKRVLICDFKADRVERSVWQE